MIVLDEATSNLDPETEVRVERALGRVCGRTAVVIAHRLRSAERADRVVMIDGGESSPMAATTIWWRPMRSTPNWWKCGSGRAWNRTEAGASRRDRSSATCLAHRRTRSGSRQSPAFFLAMDAAGNPLASAGIRPPKVICPLAWTRRMAFLTNRTGWISCVLAESSSGPLLNSHTGRVCSATRCFRMNRRASVCHRNEYRAPPRITAP